MNRPGRCRAFVIEALTVGGAEQMLVAMANAFARRGDRVHVVCLSSPGELSARLDAAVELHVLDKRLGLDWRLVPRLRALMRRLRPDVVNAHLWVANTWTRIALLGTGLRVVVTEHSRDGWKSASYRRIDRGLARVSHAIVAVSNDTAAFYRDEVGIGAERLTVINNGIDVARYAAGDGRALRASWSPDGSLLVGTVGRLIEAKNHPRFVEAIGRCARRGRGGPRGHRRRGARARAHRVGDRQGRARGRRATRRRARRHPGRARGPRPVRALERPGGPPADRARGPGGRHPGRAVRRRRQRGRDRRRGRRRERRRRRRARRTRCARPGRRDHVTRRRSTPDSPPWARSRAPTPPNDSGLDTMVDRYALVFDGPGSG